LDLGSAELLQAAHVRCGAEQRTDHDPVDRLVAALTLAKGAGVG
jgi:hypothetical protein